jgi:predicted amidophosphoribosyltransferase
MDYSNIGRERIDFWDEDNLSLSLFGYKSGKLGQTDKASQFVLCFKESGAACLSTACVQVYEALGKFSEDWKRKFDCRYIVPVPSHLAHEVSPSSKLMCGFIAKMFPWLQYPEKLLFRKESVPAAHLAYPGQRPTSTEHFQSLGCSDADLAGAGVILFDDMRTTGNTSQACRWRLQQDAKCGEVVRLFLARTVTGTDSE